MNDEQWVDCSERLPDHGETVQVYLNNGKITDDFIINGRWVWHCKLDNIGGYPIKWREIK